MAMTAAGLSAAIKTEIETQLNVTEPDDLQKVADALGKAIVEYIQSNAVTILDSGVDTGGDTLVTLTGGVT